MGQWIAKLTGQDKQIDAANRAAEDQATATATAAAATAKQNQEAAQQAGMQMELQAARTQVEMAAADAAAKPVENADVLLDKSTTVGGTAVKKRRATFGTASGYRSGVQI